MKKRIDPYKEIKRIRLPREDFDQRSARDLARADDDGFAITENKWKGRPSADRDSDCWSDLWQHIKAKGSRIFRQKRGWSQKVNGQAKSI